MRNLILDIIKEASKSVVKISIVKMLPNQCIMFFSWWYGDLEW